MVPQNLRQLLDFARKAQRTKRKLWEPRLAAWSYGAGDGMFAVIFLCDFSDVYFFFEKRGGRT